MSKSAMKLAPQPALQPAAKPATDILDQTLCETARVPDPREFLTPDKQVIVIALLSMGFSRRTAARHVGCTHTTIARAVERDPHFAFQVADAEMRADFGALKQVREASKQDKYWRAAAWYLERRLPDEFGKRPAHSFSGDQVMALLAEVFSYTIDALKESEKVGFRRAFGNTLRDVEKSVDDADRWQQLAKDDPRTGKALRSPYEHPQWCEPAELKEAAIKESAQEASEPAKPFPQIGPVPVELLAIAAAPPMSPFTPPGFRANLDQQLACASGDKAAEVRQSSQRWEKKQLRALERKFLPRNNLEQLHRSVPEVGNLHRGEENGSGRVHLGNGHS